MTTETKPKITALGKLLRIMRMDRGELLKDMARRVGVTSAYLSAVETGSKKPTRDLINKISNIYDLDEAQTQELEDAYMLSLKIIPIDLYNTNEDQQLLGLKLARAFSALSPSQIERINEILNKKKE